MVIGMDKTHSAAAHVRVGQATYPVTLADGQVRVHLPYRVDAHRLSSQLLREGFPLAHQPDTPDTQGWGPDFDSNGYYPYWVYEDPERPGGSCFAFNPHPEDDISRGGDAPVAVRLGERSQGVVERWVPVLERMAEQA